MTKLSVKSVPPAAPSDDPLAALREKRYARDLVKAMSALGTTGAFSDFASAATDLKALMETSSTKPAATEPPPVLAPWRMNTVRWIEEQHPGLLRGVSSTLSAPERLRHALAKAQYQDAERNAEAEHRAEVLRDPAVRKKGYTMTSPEPAEERTRLVSVWDEDEHRKFVEYMRDGGYPNRIVELRDGYRGTMTITDEVTGESVSVRDPLADDGAVASSREVPDDAELMGMIKRQRSQAEEAREREEAARELAEVVTMMTNPLAGAW